MGADDIFSSGIRDWNFVLPAQAEYNGFNAEWVPKAVSGE
jgi:hypothetical protein